MRKITLVLLLLVFFLIGCSTNGDDISKAFLRLSDYETLTMKVEVQLLNDEIQSVYGYEELERTFLLSKDYNYIVEDDIYIKSTSSKNNFIYDVILKNDDQYVETTMLIGDNSSKVPITPELILEALYINYPSYYEIEKKGSTYTHKDITFYVDDSGMINKFDGKDPWGYFSYTVTFSDYNTTQIDLPETKYMNIYANNLVEQAGFDQIKFDRNFNPISAKKGNLSFQFEVTEFNRILGLEISNEIDTFQIGYFLINYDYVYVIKYNGEDFSSVNNIPNLDQEILYYVDLFEDGDAFENEVKNSYDQLAFNFVNMVVGYLR